MRALASSELAASSLGVDVGATKLGVFVLTAGMAGLAGCLYVHFNQYASPETFSFGRSLLLVVAVAIGGWGRPWGPVPGALGADACCRRRWGRSRRARRCCWAPAWWPFWWPTRAGWPGWAPRCGRGCADGAARSPRAVPQLRRAAGGRGRVPGRGAGAGPRRDRPERRGKDDPVQPAGRGRGAERGQRDRWTGRRIDGLAPYRRVRLGLAPHGSRTCGSCRS